MVKHIIENYLSCYQISYDLVLFSLAVIILLACFFKNFRKVVSNIFAGLGAIFTLLYLNHYSLICLTANLYDALISFVRFNLQILEHLTLLVTRNSNAPSILKDNLVMYFIQSIIAIVFLAELINFVVITTKLNNINSIELQEEQETIKINYESINITKPIILFNSRMMC